MDDYFEIQSPTREMMTPGRRLMHQTGMRYTVAGEQMSGGRLIGWTTTKPDGSPGVLILMTNLAHYIVVPDGQV